LLSFYAGVAFDFVTAAIAPVLEAGSEPLVARLE
jgi:hypothetical protein